MKTRIATLSTLAIVMVSSAFAAGDDPRVKPVTKSSQTVKRAADGSVVSVVRNTETMIYYSQSVSETMAPDASGELAVSTRNTVTKNTEGRTLTERETLDKKTGRLVLRSRTTDARGAQGSRIRTDETYNAKTGKMTLTKRTITTRDEFGNTVVTEEVPGPNGQMKITRQVYNENTYMPYVR